MLLDDDNNGTYNNDTYNHRFDYNNDTYNDTEEPESEPQQGPEPQPEPEPEPQPDLGEGDIVMVTLEGYDHKVEGIVKSANKETVTVRFYADDAEMDFDTPVCLVVIV